MPSKINKFLYWTPRILAILFILFLALFSLDVFEPGLSASEIAIALLMHNIPSIILTILLIFAWKREWLGAIAFILGGLAYIASIIWKSLTTSFEWYHLSWSLIIAGPAFLVGVLFWLNWIKRTR